MVTSKCAVNNRVNEEKFVIISINKEAVEEFEGQDLVNCGGVVPFSAEVTVHDRLESRARQIRSGKRQAVEENLANVGGERVTVPNTKVVELVPAQKKPFEVELCERVIDGGCPLWHAVVVGVFRL